MIVTIKDNHPGKHHEGMKLEIYWAITSNHDDRPFMTALSPKFEKKGMFSNEQPLQVIKEKNGEYQFTMANLGVIPKKNLDELFSCGYTDWDNGFFWAQISTDPSNLPAWEEE